MNKNKREIDFDKWWFNMKNAALAYEMIGKYTQRDRVEKEIMEKLVLFNKSNE